MYFYLDILFTLTRCLFISHSARVFLSVCIRAKARMVNTIWNPFFECKKKSNKSTHFTMKQKNQWRDEENKSNGMNKKYCSFIYLYVFLQYIYNIQYELGFFFRSSHFFPQWMLKKIQKKKKAGICLMCFGAEYTSSSL